MQFRTRAIHVGNERDPATGRRRPADPPGRDLRPAGRRRVGRVRLLAQRQSHAQGAGNDARLARVGRAAHLAFSSGHGRHALRHDAACSRATTSWPAPTSTAAPIGCCTRWSTARASRSRSPRRPTWRRFEAAIRPETQAGLDREPRQSADVDHRHRRLRRDRPSPRRAVGRRQHVCHAGAHAAAGTGRRHRHALGHQVPRRPQRRAGRGARGARTRNCSSGSTSSRTPPAR